MDDTEGLSALAKAMADRYANEVDAETAWLAEQLLYTKAAYLDGNPNRWRRVDLDEVLMRLLPRKVMFEPGDEQLVVPVMRSLLRWLAASGLLERSEDIDVLLAHLDGRAEAVVDALLDQSRWGPGKQVLADLSGRGVDLSDPAQLEAAMREFNARPFAERDKVLGHSLDTVPAVATDPLPPVLIAPDDELDRAARGALMWQRVQQLCTYVGDRKRLTDNGNLKLADGKALVEVLGTDDRVDMRIGDKVYKTQSTVELREVDFTFTLALAAGFLDSDGRWVSNRDADVLTDKPRDAAYRLMLAMLHDVGPVTYHFGEDRYHLGWHAGLVDDELIMLLVDLYRDPGSATAEDFFDRLWDTVEPALGRPLSDAERDDAQRGLQFGVDLAVRRMTELAVLETDHDGQLRLTPLGTWQMRQWLSRSVDAPVLGVLADCSGDELLRRAADLPEPLAAAEIDHWASLHGVDALAQTLRGADATCRGLGFRALLRIGPSAADAVAQLGDDPELAAYADVWRVDAIQLAPPPADDPERLIRLLGAVLDLWGPDAMAQWPPLIADAPAPLIEQAWRVRLSQTEPVLAALGAVGDKTLAKTARKALFKHRSAR